jgi:hypothetical protein
MYRKLFYLTSFIFVLALAGYALAQDAEIPPAGTPLPVIDGVKEDVWSASAEYKLLNIEVGSAPDSIIDLSGSWWALWDLDYLYLFVDVNDEDLQNDSGESWQDDSVEIYVDGGNDKATRYGDDDYQYRAAWNTELPEIQEFHHGARSLPGVEFIVSETDDGYVLEIKFPWTALLIEKDAALGDLLGFDIHINDDDGGGGRDTKITWYGGDNAWQNPSVFGTVVLAAGLKASNPIPRHNAIGVTSGLLQWIEAKNAASYNVYFGTNPTPDELIQNQTETEYMVANLEPGTAYYWRIDVIMPDTTVQQGDIWSFTSAPLTAHSPDPADGGRYIELDADLSWQPGMYAQTHDVYFGTDETAVANADTSSDEFKGNQPLTTFEPGPMQANTTYYWRIDEVNEQHPDGSWIGDVWRFTALGAGVGIKGEYYNNANLAGEPVLTRIDDVIDFDWGQGSPDGLLDVDNFSIRWSAELEVPYTETYTFITLVTLRGQGDGVRLYINGQLIINNWPGEEFENRATVNLAAGSAQVVMEYYDGGDAAMARLSWESPSLPREIIPRERFSLPIRAAVTNPTSGATGVIHTPSLRWSPGDGAVHHHVYFGSDYNDVANANLNTPGIYRGQQDLDDTTYVPTEAPLEWNKTYYWRIDEYSVTGAINTGHIWSFTTADYIILDWFEDYTDESPDRIFDTWVDGWNVAENGSQVGYGSAPFAERNFVNSGLQSMPFMYDNTGGVAYSEAWRTFDAPLSDWTRENVQTLTLFFRGYASTFAEDPAGTYTMSAEGTDIWDLSDQFRYAYKTLSGDGSISARVVSVENTDDWAKAGVMIRETLDNYSVHGLMCVTPAGISAFQNRPIIGGDSFSAHGEPNSITLPGWVRLVRQGNTITAYYSQNGVNWVQQPDDENTDEDASLNPQTIVMRQDIYIGLAHCSHNANAIGTAVFSDVTTTGTVTGAWQVEAIGVEMPANDAQPLYIVVEGGGTEKVVEHPNNPNAVLQYTWQQWDIPLSALREAGVDLTTVQKMTIGVGSRTAPQQSGAGTLYFDDIRLYPLP